MLQHGQRLAAVERGGSQDSAGAKSEAPPVTTSPAAAVMSAATRPAPFFPRSDSSKRCAFFAGSPPLRSSGLASARPKSDGLTS